MTGAMIDFARRTAVRLCLASVLSMVLGPVKSASLPDTIDKVRPSVVAVGSYQPTRRPPGNFRGTGFVVGDGRWVVTNYHVLPEAVDYANLERIAVFVGRGKAVQMRSAKVVADDPGHDLALLSISGDPLPALALGGGRAREGEEVAFTGFPIGMVLGLYPVTNRGIISAISPVAPPQMAARQLTARQIRAMRDPYDALQLDATAYPGNSGSPVYRQDTGVVVGVVNSVLVKGTKEAALEHPTGISYAIPVKFVKALLAEAKRKAGKESP